MRVIKSMIICLGITLLIQIMGTATATDIHIHPGNSIQNAIDNASDGDTIFVYSGEYIENVYIKKELNIISQSGNPDDTIIRAANPSTHVFHVMVDNVTISGFQVVAADENAGIYFNRVDECTVTNNILLNNYL